MLILNILAQAAPHVDAETEQHLWLAVAQLASSVLIAGIGAFAVIRAGRAEKHAAESQAIVRDNQHSLQMPNGMTLGEAVIHLVDLSNAAHERRSQEHQEMMDMLRQMIERKGET